MPNLWAVLMVKVLELPVSVEACLFIKFYPPTGFCWPISMMDCLTDQWEWVEEGKEQASLKPKWLAFKYNSGDLGAAVIMCRHIYVSSLFTYQRLLFYITHSFICGSLTYAMIISCGVHVQ